jgi:hypothetical protein
MTRIKFSFQKIKLALAITLSLLSFTINPTSAQTQLAQLAEPEVSIAPRRVRFVQSPSNQEEPDLSDRGRPGADSREGGASRNGCPDVSKALTALIPVNIGKTVAEYPTFWFYTPYELTPERPIEFVLQDDQGNDLYTTDKLKALSTPPGVISFHPTSVPLKIGKNYRWYFYVYCNPEDPSEHIVVQGRIHRVALNPNQERQLKTATLQEQAILYGQAGIWYEALTAVGEQLRANPQEATIKSDWTGLLQDVDLGALATEPLQELKLKN